MDRLTGGLNPPPEALPPEDTADRVVDPNEEPLNNDDSPEQNIEQVLKQLIEAVGDLSVVARTLERWPVYVPPIGVSKEREDMERAKFGKAEIKGKQRVAEHLRRFMRKSRRIGEIVSPAFDHTNFPQDFINHIDSHLSPNLWLRGLVTEVQYANDVARGELVALGSLHATLMFYMRIVSEMSKGRTEELSSAEAMTDGDESSRIAEATVVVPDFSLPFKAPTILRPPVIYDSSKLEILMPHVLRLLNKPITPYDVDQDPKERIQRRPMPEPAASGEAGSESVRSHEAAPFIPGDGNEMAEDPLE